MRYSISTANYPNYTTTQDSGVMALSDKITSTSPRAPRKRAEKVPYEASPVNLFTFISELQLKSLGLPNPVQGKQIQNLSRQRGMTTTEISHLLGLNNASIYKKQNRNDQLNASPSILIRCYAALPQFAQPHALPTNAELVAEIQKTDPHFKKKYIAPLLGLRINGNHRLGKTFDDGSHTVKNLVYVIWTAIRENPKNWWAIKACVETEAEACGVIPGVAIWESPVWGPGPEAKKSTKKQKAKKVEAKEPISKEE